jgi:hypothetical protein
VGNNTREYANGESARFNVGDGGSWASLSLNIPNSWLGGFLFNSTKARSQSRGYMYAEMVERRDDQR